MNSKSDSSGVASQAKAPPQRRTLRQQARSAVKEMWIGLLRLSGALERAQRRLRGDDSIIVLTLHRVLGDDEYDSTQSPYGMNVREETFSELLEYIHQNYALVNLGDGVPMWNPGSGRIRFVITFDDAWYDNASVAGPMAVRQGVPFTIFACPGRMDAAYPFWPERIGALAEAAGEAGALDRFCQMAAEASSNPLQLSLPDGWRATATALTDLMKTLPAERRENVIRVLSKEFGEHPESREAAQAHRTMGWLEVTELVAEGVSFGSHSYSHEILTKIPLERAEQELSLSKKALEEKLQKPCELFSYPNGDWSPEIRELVAKAGYNLAFINDPGVWTQRSDPLSIPRVNLWEGSLVDSTGKFSPASFEFSVIWKAYRASS